MCCSEPLATKTPNDFKDIQMKALLLQCTSWRSNQSRDLGELPDAVGCCFVVTMNCASKGAPRCVKIAVVGHNKRLIQCETQGILVSAAG